MQIWEQKAEKNANLSWKQNSWECRNRKLAGGTWHLWPDYLFIPPSKGQSSKLKFSSSSEKFCCCGGVQDKTHTLIDDVVGAANALYWTRSWNFEISKFQNPPLIFSSMERLFIG